MGGTSPKSATQRSLGGSGFYNVYRTSDDKFVVLGGRELKFATNLLTALGRPDLIAIAETEAGPEQAPLIDFLRESFAAQSRDYWTEWFNDKDVAFAPVLDFREALDQEFVRENNLLIEANGSHMIGPTFKFASEPDWQPTIAPEFGK